MNNKDTEKTRKRYDLLRSKIPIILPPDLLVITRGIACMGDLNVVQILEKVKKFDDFNEGNDPYGIHDFGIITHKNEKIYWKIDNYNGQEGYNLVLTVLLAEEY